MSRFTPTALLSLPTLALLALAGCMVGPNYHRPAAIVSPKLKEAQPPPGWVKAQPDMAMFPKGDWWTIFHDPLLDKLEHRVATSNQSLKEYVAQYHKAAAMIDSIRANLFPTINGKFSFGHTMHGAYSTNSATGGSTGYYTKGGSRSISSNSWDFGPSASWTIDVWGQIRRQVQEQVTATQASAAQVANMKLSYELQLAEDYFDLRYQDSLIALYARNVKLYRHNLDILENQLAAGVADPASVLQARYQYQGVEASLANAHVARAQYEHAIAVLAGMPPAELTIPPAPLPSTLPPPPLVVPSTLLQRRPDIAQAEREMASNNAEIGYEIGAFYPQITLSSNYGYSGNPITQLFRLATESWEAGAGATETIFEGGSRTAAVRGARADYANAVAAYRQTVLTAFQQIEDQLSNLRYLGEQMGLEKQAVKSADEAVRVSMNEYLAGTQIYTTVISAQQTALQYEQTCLQIQEQRYQSELNLITDLGGGWSVKDLPTKNQLQQDNPFLPSFIQPNIDGAPNMGTTRQSLAGK
ncbi:efflux transporter outer membrane subunit [Oecophyllibacter saccharovorans]|uniref:Efflux transporter outer membrane subunit n=1 Tax=Oecophyllibacter saccharovorans TaxID=2558360 RepID=A0A506US56_9PROT|nr:efflux transporter outer membrane subunit [Oecophyllibacter saccharovorans]QDH14784.1 efflux transporter outer membrane subunit [Oecophyllibacter saccharovorans]TPW35923.1 efflux transporter outer membrane subunit [Oecophyllibacter saccharovorans]